MPFRNFKIWHGRLPHWRADDVRYYVTFRHRRPLAVSEQGLLLNAFLKASRSRAEILVACVLPEETELLLTVGQDRKGETVELSDVVESAKRRAGKAIVKLTEERFPPFYEESYDRIVRDDAEFEERWNAILESPVKAELVGTDEPYPFLWLAHA